MNEILFSYEKMGTKTRIEEEAKGNSEMAYFLLGLVSLDCRLRQLAYFSESLSKKERLYLSSSCFSHLFHASTRIFCALSFAQSRKIVRHFKTQREKFCNDDVNRASVI